MYSPDVVSFPLNDGILLIGRGSAIPMNMHRFALASMAEIRAHLTTIQYDPMGMMRLRLLANRTANRSFDRDTDLVNYLVNTAASPQHLLLVIDLGHSRFTIRTSNEKVAVEFNKSALQPVASHIVGGAGNLQMVAPADALRVASVRGPMSLQMVSAHGSTQVGGADVRLMSLDDRFMEVVKRLSKFLPAAAAAEIEGLFSTGTMAMLIGTLVLWAGAHYIGVGEAIDVLLVAVGFAFLGLQIFDVAKYLVKCILQTIGAKTEADLDAAAELLAKVIAIIGITALLTLVTKTVGKKFSRSPAKNVAAEENAAVTAAKTKTKGPTSAATTVDPLHAKIRQAGFNEKGTPLAKQTVNDEAFLTNQAKNLEKLTNKKQLMKDARAAGVDDANLQAMLNREKPLSFKSKEQFQQFQREFGEAARADGFDGPMDVSMSGSSTSFYSNNPKKPGHFFDRDPVKNPLAHDKPGAQFEVSDVDLSVKSKSLSDYLARGDANGPVRSKDSYNIFCQDETRDFLRSQGKSNLTSFQDKWTQELGRPVNIVPFKNVADPRIAATDFVWSPPP
jgi:hypothetical protein